MIENYAIRSLCLWNCEWFNASNAEATFVQSTRMQKYLYTIENPVMQVFIG